MIKYISPLFIISLFLSCSDEESNNKNLFYTFSDNGIGALAATKIEPASNTTVALHTSDIRDIEADFPKKNLYASMGQNAEIWVYKTTNIDETDILYETEYGVGPIAIDTDHNKIYWVTTNWGMLYSANLDGSSTTHSKLFGGASLTNICTGLAVDPTHNKLFVLDAEGKRILVADLNSGNAPTELVTSADFEMETPHDLVISKDGNTLYWADVNRIISTNAATGESSVFRPSSASSLFLHHETNFLYISFSRIVAKTEIGGAPGFQEVFEEEAPILQFVVD